MKCFFCKAHGEFLAQCNGNDTNGCIMTITNARCCEECIAKFSKHHQPCSVNHNKI